MADNETNDLPVDNDFIERLKQRDARWRDVETAIKIEEELRASTVVQIILSTLQEQAEKSLDELQVVDPTDARKIASLQEKVKCVRLLGNTLEAVRSRGKILQQELEHEGRIDLDTGDNYGGPER